MNPCKPFLFEHTVIDYKWRENDEGLDWVCQCGDVTGWIPRETLYAQ